MVVHGAVLLRTLVRSEFPGERSEREAMELGKLAATTAPGELIARLKATRGVVHFEDLTGVRPPTEPEGYGEPVFGDNGRRRDNCDDSGRH